MVKSAEDKTVEELKSTIERTQRATEDKPQPTRAIEITRKEHVEELQRRKREEIAELREANEGAGESLFHAKRSNRITDLEGEIEELEAIVEDDR